MRFFRIPSFTGIESHRDDADRGSLRAIEGCLPHGPGGVRSAPVWEEVGEVDMFSETEYNMISAADDGNGNSLLFVSRLGQVTDIAILSTENTEVGPFGDNYLVSDSIVHNQKTGAISPIGDRKFAVGDGTAEAIYVGKGPPGGSASVFPDEVLYRQEWSRFPNCKHYVQGPNKTLYAAGNPEKPLTIYVSEPAGSTNPNVDSPYSTELTPPANKPGKLSTVDILASKASKITALTSNGSQVIVHTDKGCHVLYAPSADQANTGYRVEQAPSSVFSAAVSPRTALSDNGSMIFWLGHDGQIYKDESAGRGSEDAKKFTDPGQANWKSKGVWEKAHPKDLSDSFSFYDPQSGYYWVFIRSLASLDYAGSLSPNRPTMLEALPAAPSIPGNLQASIVAPSEPLTLAALPQAPAQPGDLQSLVQAPSSPTDFVALPTNAPATPTDLLASPAILPPVSGPVNIQALESGPVAGPTDLSAVMLAPAAGPTNLNTSLQNLAPGSGPGGLTASYEWDQAEAFSQSANLLGFISRVVNNVPSLSTSTCGINFRNACPSTFQGTVNPATGLRTTGDGTSTDPYMTEWYPDHNIAATTAKGYQVNAATDLYNVWSNFSYAGTRNLDDLGQSFGQWTWLSTNGAQHSWSFTVQAAASAVTYWLVYDPSNSQYCVVEGRWANAGTNNGNYSIAPVYTKANNFNNALDPNNPFGTYILNSGVNTWYILHVGDGVSDANLSTDTDFQARYTVPFATVNGVQVDCKNGTSRTF